MCSKGHMISAICLPCICGSDKHVVAKRDGDREDACPESTCCLKFKNPSFLGFAFCFLLCFLFDAQTHRLGFLQALPEKAYILVDGSQERPPVASGNPVASNRHWE